MKFVTSLMIVMLLCMGMVSLLSAQNPPDDAKEHTAQHIPTTLEEAHQALEKTLDKETLQAIDAMGSEDEMIKFHFGLGRSLRNDWGLWKGSPLADDLRKKGFNHPDDMSSVILNTFWCKRHNKPFDLKARAEAYDLYWRSQKKPGADIKDPRDSSDIQWANFTLSLQTPNGHGYTVHVGKSKTTGAWVAYDCIKGAYAPDDTLLGRINAAAKP